jgi:hypothetical protein
LEGKVQREDYLSIQRNTPREVYDEYKAKVSLG